MFQKNLFIEFSVIELLTLHWNIQVKNRTIFQVEQFYEQILLWKNPSQ